MDCGLGCLSPKRVIYACSHLLLIQELQAHIPQASADFKNRISVTFLARKKPFKKRMLTVNKALLTNE
jgi:hypothetical protein